MNDVRPTDANALRKMFAKHCCKECCICPEVDQESGECWLILSPPAIDAVPVVRCKDCVYFRKAHVLTADGQRKSYEEFPPEAFDVLGTGSVTQEYGINVGSQCLVDCNRGYGEDKTVFREANDFCSRGFRKTDNK